MGKLVCAVWLVCVISVDKGDKELIIGVEDIVLGISTQSLERGKKKLYLLLRNVANEEASCLVLTGVIKLKSGSLIRDGEWVYLVYCKSNYLEVE